MDERRWEGVLRGGQGVGWVGRERMDEEGSRGRRREEGRGRERGRRRGRGFLPILEKGLNNKLRIGHFRKLKNVI